MRIVAAVVFLKRKSLVKKAERCGLSMIGLCGSADLIPTEAWSCLFAITPSSASCERVFALLENMFGEDHSRARGHVFLRYNGRRVVRLRARAPTSVICYEYVQGGTRESSRTNSRN